MKRILKTAAALVLALSLAACEAQPAIVGRWSAGEGDGAIEIEFKADKTFALKLGGVESLSGTYETEGNTFTFFVRGNEGESGEFTNDAVTLINSADGSRLELKRAD